MNCLFLWTTRFDDYISSSISFSEIGDLPVQTAVDPVKLVADMVEQWVNELVHDPRWWWCKTRAFQKCFGCFIMCSDKFIRKGLGRILLFFVYSLVSFVLVMVFAVALPYESLWMPKPLMLFLVILAVYLFVNILYHYHKASNTPAGRPPKKIEQDPNVSLFYLILR
uniref:Uncharacterized protein n=1 Tax=Panagrolaimus superbus TaxID=310955 RepID=A0A914YTV8_9BILA